MIVFLVPMLLVVAVFVISVVLVTYDESLSPNVAKSMAQDAHRLIVPGDPESQYTIAHRLIYISHQTQDIAVRNDLRRQAYQLCRTGVALEASAR